MNSPVPPGTPWQHLAGERFVSLTTFRRTGAPVPTPVWIAGFHGALVVTTPAASGKVKRLRNDGRVRLQPCSRSGTVAPGTPTTEATAVVLGPAAEHRAEADAIRRKYGLEYRIIVAVEGLTRRIRRHTAERLILRIDPATDAAPSTAGTA